MSREELVAELLAAKREIQAYRVYLCQIRQLCEKAAVFMATLPSNNPCTKASRGCDTCFECEHYLTKICGYGVTAMELKKEGERT